MTEETNAPAAPLDLTTLVLLSGSHTTREEGLCVMEAVSYVAGEKHSDSPQCACPVIAAFARRLNDRFNDEQRQLLKPFVLKLVGTRDPKKEKARAALAVNWSYREVLPKFLELAGLDREAGELREWPALNTGADFVALRKRLYEIRDLARAKRDAAWAALTPAQRAAAAAYAYADADAAYADAAADAADADAAYADAAAYAAAAAAAAAYDDAAAAYDAYAAAAAAYADAAYADAAAYAAAAYADADAAKTKLLALRDSINQGALDLLQRMIDVQIEVQA